MKPAEPGTTQVRVAVFENDRLVHEWLVATDYRGAANKDALNEAIEGLMEKYGEVEK